MPLPIKGTRNLWKKGWPQAWGAERTIGAWAILCQKAKMCQRMTEMYPKDIRASLKEFPLIDLSSLKNLLPGLPTRLTSHQGYFQLCTQNRQGDDELELMNGSKTRRSAGREQGLDQLWESPDVTSRQIEKCWNDAFSFMAAFLSQEANLEDGG